MKTSTTGLALLCLSLYCITGSSGQGISFAVDPKYRAVSRSSNPRDVAVSESLPNASLVTERDVDYDDGDGSEDSDDDFEDDDEVVGEGNGFRLQVRQLERRKKPCKKGYKLNKKGKCKKSGAFSNAAARPGVALLVALAILALAQL